MKLHCTIQNSDSCTELAELRPRFPSCCSGAPSAQGSRAAESPLLRAPRRSAPAARLPREARQEHGAPLQVWVAGGGSRSAADPPRDESTSPRAEASAESSGRCQAQWGCPVLCSNSAWNGNVGSQQHGFGFSAGVCLHTTPPARYNTSWDITWGFLAQENSTWLPAGNPSAVINSALSKDAE